MARHYYRICVRTWRGHEGSEMAARLTDKLVRALKPPPATNGRGNNRITYDDSVPGFGARITSAGAVSFVLNYRRKADGLERRYTIGTFPSWSVTAARKEAKRLKREVDGGGDPVGKFQAEREAPTVAGLCVRFETEHLPRLRPTTAQMYRGLIKNEVVPTLGRMKVAAVVFADIDRLHRDLSRRAPYLANRLLALLSKMFGLAVLWNMRPASPVRGVQRNQEIKRKRYLSGNELARLTKALAEHHNREAADALRLILLTGARKSEVLSATWSQFDFGAGTWTKPGATTKQKTDHSIPLSAHARQLLTQIRERNSSAKFVFPGPGPTGRRTSVKRDWEQICKVAEITGLRVHDLRHSYAAQLASAGIGLHVIGRLLGHTQPQTTHRYAHLLDDPLRQATERVGAIIAGEPVTEVMPLDRWGRRQ
jgi:integrase